MPLAIAKEIEDYVNYITNADHIWNKDKYIGKRAVSGKTASGVEFNFQYSYAIGSSFMTGTFGSEGETVEVYYRDLQGFQIVRIRDGIEVERASYTPYQRAAFQEHLQTMAL